MNYDIFYALAKMKGWCLKPKGCLVAPFTIHSELEGRRYMLGLSICRGVSSHERSLRGAPRILQTMLWKSIRLVLDWVFQVIQFVTFLSPIVWGHQQPLKGSLELTIPKRSRSQNCQGFDMFFRKIIESPSKCFSLEVCKCSSCFYHWLSLCFMKVQNSCAV